MHCGFDSSKFMDAQSNRMHEQSKTPDEMTRPVAIVVGSGALAAAMAIASGLVSTALVMSVTSGANLLHYDAKAHLLVARRVLDSLTPGWLQLGVVWLPLPHLLNALPAQSDLLYATGAFASAAGAVAFVAGLAALGLTAARATRDEWAGVVAIAVPVLNPGWLYLAVTPMTEPLAFGLASGTAAYLVRWRLEARRADLTRAAVCAALACWVRYEAWAVAAAAAVVVAATRSLSARGDAVRFAALALLAPVALYGAHSWAAAGRPFVMMTPEFLTGTRGHPAQAIALAASGVAEGFGLGLAAAALVAFAVLLARRDPLAAPVLVLLAAAGVTVAAYLQGHPPKARYALLLAPDLALAVAGATARSRPAQLLALALALSQPLLVASPSPALAEATRHVGAAIERRPIVAAFRREYRGGRLLASMGSSAPFLFELQLPLREVVHEGNHPIWERALARPRREAAYVLITAGDVIDQQRRRRPDLLDGFEEWLRFGKSVVYRRSTERSDGGGAEGREELAEEPAEQRGAQGHAGELEAGAHARLAGEDALEHPDGEQRADRKRPGDRQRPGGHAEQVGHERHRAAHHEGEEHHEPGLEGVGQLGGAQAEHLLLHRAQQQVLLAGQRLYDPVRRRAVEPFRGERLQQSLLGQVGLLGGELRLIRQHLLDELLLGARGEVGARGHRDAAGHRGGQAGQHDQAPAVGGGGDAAEQPDRADEPVLDPEDELAHADLALQLALLAAERGQAAVVLTTGHEAQGALGPQLRSAGRVSGMPSTRSG